MLIVENAPLSDHSTMRLGGIARFLCYVTSENELLEAINYSINNNLNVRMIGSGSNIIWNDNGFDGLIIVNEIKGIDISENIVDIGSGVIWDEAVKYTVNAGLSGIEFLSLIPGTTGATPVQNVGAYGVEIKDLLIELRAYDMQSKTFVTLGTDECQFGYRTSRFKTSDQGRFLITKIKLKLSKNNPKPPFYESLQSYLNDSGITEYTAQNIRDAVVNIRNSKLPDPDFIANNGSFFANPIIDKIKYNELVKKFPDIKAWDHLGKKKIAAGWLVEKAGFKDFHDKKTGMATWKNQSLVLVNENASSTKDLISFRNQIVFTVKEKFDIELEQEPELL